MKRIHQQNINLLSFGNPKHEYQKDPGITTDPLYSFLIPRIPRWVKTVLDCGCGFGIGSHLLYRAGFDVEGCDFSEPRLQYAREKFSPVKFFSQDLTKPLGKSYDCIVCVEVLEHMDDPVCLLNEMRSKSKIVLVTVPKPGKCNHFPEHMWDFVENDFCPPMTWLGPASHSHRAGVCNGLIPHSEK